MAKYTLSETNLEAHLKEQLGSLQRAAHRFDEGIRSEAKGMAAILRILLHSKRHPSLLKRLNCDQIPFLDTASVHDTSNLIAFTGLLFLRSGETFGYFPRFDCLDEPVLWTPFEAWWSKIIFADGEKWHLTRRDVVITAADQDGGAHVDGAIEFDYAALSRENSLGWRRVIGTGTEVPIEDAELFAIRQITHEVLRTLIPGYVRTPEQAIAAERPTEIAGGKLRFGPGKKDFMQPRTTLVITEGVTYQAEMEIDSISTGSVRWVVGGTACDPVTNPGRHKFLLVAGAIEGTGIFGEYTDAILDNVSLQPVGKTQ